MSDPADGLSGAEPPDLDVALGRLRRQVEVPPRPDYLALVGSRIDALESPGGRRAGVNGRLTWHALSAAAAVVLVVVTATLALPVGRQALADVLEIAGVRVRPLPATSAEPRTRLDARLDLGEPVTLARAQALVSFQVAVPTDRGLADPDRVYVHTGRGVESVTLLYRPRPGLPGVLGGRVGLLLSEYAGSAEPYFYKYVDMRRPPHHVTVAGRWPGLRFSGRQQVLVLDPEGKVRAESARISAPSLVWVRDDVTYRLEADIDQRRALDIAGSVG